MVALDVLPGLEVWVEVDDEPLLEHDDQSGSPDRQRSITRFIAAKSGQNFKIGLEVTDTNGWKGEGIDIETMVDGVLADTFICFKEDIDKEGVWCLCESMALANGNYAKFKFTALDIAIGKKKLKKEVKQLAKVGQIEIRIWSIENIEETGSSLRKTYKQPSGIGVVSEKAVKGRAVSHSVEFDEVYGDEEAEIMLPEFTCTYMEPKGKPFAKYIFCYRSMEALKSLAIVPRTPSPEPPPPLEERDITTLNPEELKELQQRFLAMRDQHTQIKRERTEGEPSAKARKRSRKSAGTVQLEIDEEGGFRQVATVPVREEVEAVIELD